MAIFHANWRIDSVVLAGLKGAYSAHRGRRAMLRPKSAMIIGAGGATKQLRACREMCAHGRRAA